MRSSLGSNESSGSLVSYNIFKKKIASKDGPYTWHAASKKGGSRHAVMSDAHTNAPTNAPTNYAIWRYLPGILREFRHSKPDTLKGKQRQRKDTRYSLLMFSRYRSCRKTHKNHDFRDILDIFAVAKRVF